MQLLRNLFNLRRKEDRMRSRFFLLLSLFFIASKGFADTSSVAIDSASKPFTPPNQGPLGIDNITGLALYGAAIVFAVLIIALWRNNIVKLRNKNA
jgi:hypothetical protein